MSDHTRRDVLPCRLKLLAVEIREAFRTKGELACRTQYFVLYPFSSLHFAVVVRSHLITWLMDPTAEPPRSHTLAAASSQR